jgi:hypothetical protein
MTDLLLNSNDQGKVEFIIWKSLQYKTRLFISLCVILVGFVAQYITFSIFPGVIIILLGNLLLLPKGVTNTAKIGLYDSGADWEKVEARKFDEVVEFTEKMKKWDKAPIDISNPMGGCLFFLLLVIDVVLFFYAFDTENYILEIMCVDFAVLVFPYWLWGKRSILTVPLLIQKIKLIKTILSTTLEGKSVLSAHTVDYFFLLKGKKIPDDVKFKVNIAGQSKDFLGFYGQISINNGIYPYFYVVLVARKGFGLDAVYREYSTPAKLLAEFKKQEDVEVLVLRQDTKKLANGYITSVKQAVYVFLEGLKLAEKAAV